MFLGVTRVLYIFACINTCKCINKGLERAQTKDKHRVHAKGKKLEKWNLSNVSQLTFIATFYEYSLFRFLFFLSCPKDRVSTLGTKNGKKTEGNIRRREKKKERKKNTTIGYFRDSLSDSSRDANTYVRVASRNRQAIFLESLLWSQCANSASSCPSRFCKQPTSTGLLF